jgi:hypothetical protein
MKEVTYLGQRQDGGAVTVWRMKDNNPHNDQRQELTPTASQDLINHSPNGFEWGYGGSGPAQLALAICLDAIGDPDMALRVYQEFKWRVIARLQHETWRIRVQFDGEEIDGVAA